MPRPLVFGNGSLLIGVDDNYAIRDLFWPQVGYPNHLAGHKIRTGFWVNGKYAWCDEPGWQRTLTYKPGTLVGLAKLTNAALGIEVTCEECVDPRRPEYVRRMTVRNLTGTDQDVRVYFTHDLRIDESDVGDTAFYNPFLDGVVHYKGFRYFLFGGCTSRSGVREYATGIKAFGGMEGTWRDAEDGQLSNNPIAQGSVDSTFGLHTRVAAGASEPVWYWLFCGSKLEEVGELYHQRMREGLDRWIPEVERYGQSWVSRAEIPGLDRLSPRIQELFRQSLLIMSTQIDEGGAILAANDTDIMVTNRATYSYMWPRDGALVSTVFDRLGFRQTAQRFFDFCTRILSTDRPILLQKYRPDGSLGATWHPWLIDNQPEVPFQEDETALTITAIWEYYSRHRETELLGELWTSFVLPTAQYIERYRDPETKLPLPSWDLWEERHGIHNWTVCSVIQCLDNAAKIAHELGEEGHATSFRETAAEMREALVNVMYNESAGCYDRRIEMPPDGSYRRDGTIDCSVLAVLLMDVLPPNHPTVVSTVKKIEQTLKVRSKIGGLSRYEGDYYFRRSDRYPGNPWIICTLWLAQVKIKMAQTAEDLAEPMRWLEWTCDRAASTGVLAEQVHPETGEPLSVSPLTWSHAEFVETVVAMVEAQARIGALAGS